ncbi:uncharacterized protein BDCG_08926 [Blastomyces dermatitidis ER-3]|uniref:Nucleic acid-binding protein n=2 Tax=Ajellomyces dermatitidis TaxID=5039 RepID=F2THF1_AJEDA|nr:uncharacterized protein BDCG_08926 [Blastomyces dermatitidis ER-3]EEQ85657.1 hypothetical protein BDCG_08926 [Blastomyces dermatitidis ER-3]EGE82664.1 hypothetical protein BDDG_05608 [Blastomyces dermatitidis ATCC 18188]
MPVKVITLTGAPRPSALKWDVSELLNECWFCLLGSGDGRGTTEAGPVRWRRIEQGKRHYGFPGEHDEVDENQDDENIDYEGTEFFAQGGAIERHTGLQATLDIEVEAGSEFYDHSFAVHEGGGDSILLSGMDSFSTESNFETTVDDISIVSAANQSTEDHDTDSHQHPLPPPLRGHLSDLRDIPSAAYLHSISPRMIPINLIVAIITIYPRKRVRTRWGDETDVVELVVGDETRSGFQITCWLSLKGGESGDGAKQGLDGSIRGLRPRDIVLFRSVALNSFRGKVYGQSLKDNMTKVDLLHRAPIDPSDEQGLFTAQTLADRTSDSHPQLVKVRRVRDWILDFISPHIYGKVDQSSIRPGVPGDEPCLPPDTQ